MMLQLQRFSIAQVNRDDVRQPNVANEIANLQRGSGGGYSGGMNMPLAFMPGPIELLVIGVVIAIPVGAVAVLVWLLRKK